MKIKIIDVPLLFGIYFILFLSSCNVLDQPTNNLLTMEMEWERIQNVYGSKIKRDSQNNYWLMSSGNGRLQQFDSSFNLIDEYYFQPDDYDSYRFNTFYLSPENEVYATNTDIQTDVIYRLDRDNRKLIKLKNFAKMKIYSLSFYRSRIYVSGFLEGGRYGETHIRYSDDKGNTWHNIPTIAGTHYCSDFYQIDSNELLALISGDIYSSSDFGSNWEKEVDSIRNFNMLVFAENYVFATEGEHLIRSGDGGKVWEPMSGICESLFSDKGLVFATAPYDRNIHSSEEMRKESMRLRFSTNFGEDWISIKAPTIRRSSKVFLDDSYHVIVNLYGGAWRSKQPLPSSY